MLQGQEYKNHLTKKVEDVDSVEKSTWKKIDAQLFCSIFKSTVHRNIKTIFCPHLTRESVSSWAKKFTDCWISSIWRR